MGTGRTAKATGNRALLALAAAALVAVTFNVAPESAASSAISSRVAASTTTGSVGPPAAAGTSPYYEVKTGTVRGLGTVLVNGQGMTLYMFAPDHQRGRSTCYKACASGWPPLRLPTGVTTPVAAGRDEASLLGTTTRKDGGLQVTYNGWPLYLWEVDTAPGEATGQGLNSLGGVWYVLSPKGKVIKTKQRP
jgi:predicted lipoprotein with Yx(FWY)xxD motif